VPGESDEHRRLKEAACWWLWNQGFRAVAAEVPAPGIGVVDAVAAGKPGGDVSVSVTSGMHGQGSRSTPTGRRHRRRSVWQAAFGGPFSAGGQDIPPGLCYDPSMSDSTQLDALSSAAQDFARRGGRLALERFGKARASQKPDMTIVTDADLAVQELIVAAIGQRFPGHAVLGEESGSEDSASPSPERAEFCWIIDPIDGTRNYYRGFPCFCTSVGLLRSGTPVVGAVYDPLLDRMYHGTVGGGAFVDDRPLCAGNDPAHANSLIGVPSGHNQEMPRAVHDWLDRLNLRNTGSAALHLAYVAAGWLDAAYARDCKIWDVAAGWVLVREAGAVITGHAGGELFPASRAALGGENMPFLAAGPKLHAELLETAGK